MGFYVCMLSKWPKSWLVNGGGWSKKNLQSHGMILQVPPNLTPYCSWVSASSRWWVSRVSRPPSALPPLEFRRVQGLSSAYSKSGTWSLQLWRTRREKWRVFFYLVGGFEPTQLKNMRKSNWIISPRVGVKKKCLKPTPGLIFEN